MEKEAKLLQAYQISLPLHIVYNTNNMQIHGPLKFWIILPTQRFHFSQSPCTPSSKDNLLLSHLSSGRPRLLVQQEWRDQGMTPRPRPFPCPSGLCNPLDRRLNQGWGWGAASHFRAELSMNQEGKWVGAAEQSAGAGWGGQASGQTSLAE